MSDESNNVVALPISFDALSDAALLDLAMRACFALTERGVHVQVSSTLNDEETSRRVLAALSLRAGVLQ